MSTVTPTESETHRYLLNRFHIARLSMTFTSVLVGDDE
jgi:hypothetical protein